MSIDRHKDYNEYKILSDELINLERKRKIILMKAFIVAILRSTILAIAILIGGHFLKQYGGEIFDFYDSVIGSISMLKKILTVLIALVIYGIPFLHFFNTYLKKQVAFKNEFLKAVIPIYNKGLNVIDEREISDDEKDEFNMGNIFSKYHDNYHTNTYSEGKINNLKIKVADLYIYEVSTNGKGHIITDFDGILEIIELPINYDGFAILEKKEMFRQNKYMKYENQIDKELSKNFNFYTDNINDATTFFTKDIIKTINIFYNTYKIPLYITIKDNKLYIGFDNRRGFTKKLCLSKINDKNINTIIYNFNQVWDFTENFINNIIQY